MFVLHRKSSDRSLSVSVVLHAEQLDHPCRLLSPCNPARDPTGFGKDVVRSGTTGGDHLIAKLARQRQVGQPVAVDMAMSFRP